MILLQYLDQRFDPVIRIIGAGIFIFQTAFYIAIVTYSPALAIEAGRKSINQLINQVINKVAILSKAHFLIKLLCTIF